VPVAIEKKNNEEQISSMLQWTNQSALFMTRDQSIYSAITHHNGPAKLLDYNKRFGQCFGNMEQPSTQARGATGYSFGERCQALN
jgi:hypothetical protein